MPATRVEVTRCAGNPGRIHAIRLNYFQDEETLSRTLSLADGVLNLGKIKDVVNTAGATSASVTKNNNKVLVWLGGATPSGVTTTSNFDLEVRACLDSNLNNQCDSVEAQACTSAGNSWSETTGTCITQATCTSAGGVWETSIAGDKCCGDDAGDLGRVDGKWLCYKEGTLWQWLDATADANKFKIKTAGSSDFVSNAGTWFSCAVASGTTSIAYGGAVPFRAGSDHSDRARTAKFICAQRDVESQFLECCIDGAGDERACDNTNRKATPGDAVHWISQTGFTKTFASTTDTQELMTPFRDWSAATTLAVVFKTSASSTVSVDFYNSANALLRSQQLNSVVVNSPAAASKWLTASIPLSAITLTDVAKLVFKTGSIPNTLDVERVWLVAPGEKYCSGTTYLEGFVDSLWATDADNNAQGGDGQPVGKSLCTAINSFGWTGVKCCGDDAAETYADTDGGCWQSNFVTNGSIVAGTVEKVIYSGKVFRGCPASDFTGDPDIEGANSCDVRTGFFCSIEDNKWSNQASGTAPAAARNTVKNRYTGGTTGTAQSCCPDDRCWDGTTCAANIAGAPDAPPQAANYRCINGNWVGTPLVYTWGGVVQAGDPDTCRAAKNCGYCAADTQCLVDPEGSTALNNQPESYYLGQKPQCIGRGQFILDNYCDIDASGQPQWSTRTKLLALELLNLMAQTGEGGQPYTLYCDDYSSTLVDTGYQNVQDYILGPQVGTFRQPCVQAINERCVNNFCVLQYIDHVDGPKRVFGVSLNKNINDAQLSFLRALGKLPSDCDSLSGTGPFKECSGSGGKIWYSTGNKSILYSNDDINYAASYSLLENLRARFQTFINWLRGYQPPPLTQPPLSFIEQAKRFDKLYIHTGGGKDITAVQERVGDRSAILARYKGFTTNICGYINNKARQLGIPGSGTTYPSIACNFTAANNLYDVATKEAQELQLWQNLTSQLRVP